MSRAGCGLWALTANPCPAWPQWTGALCPGFRSDQGSDPALQGLLVKSPPPLASVSLKTSIAALERVLQE